MVFFSLRDVIVKIMRLFEADGSGCNFRQSLKFCYFCELKGRFPV